MPGTHDTSTPAGAFLADNPWAARAVELLEVEMPTPHAVAMAQANATLALAYEQRQTRFHLDNSLANHAQQTASI